MEGKKEHYALTPLINFQKYCSRLLSSFDFFFFLYRGQSDPLSRKSSHLLPLHKTILWYPATLRIKPNSLIGAWRTLRLLNPCVALQTHLSLLPLLPSPLVGQPWKCATEISCGREQSWLTDSLGFSCSKASLGSHQGHTSPELLPAKD